MALPVHVLVSWCSSGWPAPIGSRAPPRVDDRVVIIVALLTGLVLGPFGLFVVCHPASARVPRDAREVSSNCACSNSASTQRALPLLPERGQRRILCAPLHAAPAQVSRAPPAAQVGWRVAGTARRRSRRADAHTGLRARSLGMGRGPRARTAAPAPARPQTVSRAVARPAATARPMKPKGPHLVEQKVVMVRPDGVRQCLVREVVGRFERLASPCAASRPCASITPWPSATTPTCRQAFFESLVSFITSGPWSRWYRRGADAIAVGTGHARRDRRGQGGSRHHPRRSRCRRSRTSCTAPTAPKARSARSGSFSVRTSSSSTPRCHGRHPGGARLWLAAARSHRASASRVPSHGAAATTRTRRPATLGPPCGQRVRQGP